jgi:hypothetical protein
VVRDLTGQRLTARCPRKRWIADAHNDVDQGCRFSGNDGPDPIEIILRQAIKNSGGSALNKNQLRAMISVAAMALLALPAYLMIGVLTIPLAVGLLMLTASSPWILRLYPFVFAGYGHWTAPQYYLGTALSVPLTIVQWALISWLASLMLRHFRGHRLFLGALAVLLIVGIVTSAILSLTGIKMMWTAAHT